MRGILCLVASDVRYGMGDAVRGRLALFAVASTVVLFLSYALANVMIPELEGVTLGESLLFVWRGTRPYVAQSALPFKVPTQWLAVIACATYVCADYPVRDLSGFGAQVVVACGNRWKWWLARCCWVVACALTCFLITVAVGLALTVVSGGEVSLSVRPEVVDVLGVGSHDLLLAAAGGLTTDGDYSLGVGTQPQIPVIGAVLAIPALLAASMMLEFVVALFAGPVAGFAVGVAVPFASTLIPAGWLPGAYLMMGRTSALMRGGTSPAIAAVVAGAWIASLAIAGGIAFRRMDILGRREGDAL